MKPLHSFIRGGQLVAHGYRMLKQICVITLGVTLVTGVAVFCAYFFLTTTAYQRALYLDSHLARFKLEITFGESSKVMQTFTYPDGKTEEVRALAFLKNPWVKHHVHTVEECLQKSLKRGLWWAFWAFLCVAGYFIRRGYKTSRKKLERGNQIMTPKVLKQLIREDNQISDLKLDGLPLLKNKETSHILITGTTGSGKTNCFHTLLPQIRRRPNRAIIVDLTGDFVNRYYQEGHDILLSPFDPRTLPWSPWEECLEEPHYDTLAAAFVAHSSSSEPFWENAARVLLARALRHLQEKNESDVAHLYKLLVTDDLVHFTEFFRNTEAASQTHANAEKMTLSIRATLPNHLQGLRHLKPLQQGQKGFSIREWIASASKTENQWLFLAARPDQREIFRPLLSCWIDTAISGLMSLSPDPKRRLWFILDELPSLQRLPSLATGLAEARKYGGCFKAGVQKYLASVDNLWCHASPVPTGSLQHQNLLPQHRSHHNNVDLESSR